MKLDAITPDKLIPHPRNSRTHSREQIHAIARALQEFGFTQPVVADENLTILVGHGRVEAAKALGLATVPVLVRKGLSDERKRALLLSDNRLAELGSSWDKDMLSEELHWLLDADFDVTLTAFDLPEIAPAREAAPERKQATVVTVPGDTWRLGPHFLACGTAAPMPETAMPETAPPAVLVTRVGAANQEAAAAAIAATEARAAYVWHEPATATATARALEAAGFDLRAQIIRERESPSGSERYPRQHDPCWYAVRKGVAAGYRGGRTQSTLWLTGGGAALPVECWKRPMQNHLPPGGVAIDPLAGTGCVFIAAQQTARIAVGLEADPALCDEAIERWEIFTAKEAVHGGTGKTYRETAQERPAP